MMSIKGIVHTLNSGTAGVGVGFGEVEVEVDSGIVIVWVLLQSLV
jgi:hypothetical protein